MFNLPDDNWDRSSVPTALTSVRGVELASENEEEMVGSSIRVARYAARYEEGLALFEDRKIDEVVTDTDERGRGSVKPFAQEAEQGCLTLPMEVQPQVETCLPQVHGRFSIGEALARARARGQIY